MSLLRLSIDEDPHSLREGDLLERLVVVLRELVPEQPDAVSSDAAIPEVTALVQVPSEPNIARFIKSILTLSSTSGCSFTIATTLDSNAQRAQSQRFPFIALGKGHIVHVRPDEGPALQSYFRCLFGAP